MFTVGSLLEGGHQHVSSRKYTGIHISKVFGAIHYFFEQIAPFSSKSFYQKKKVIDLETVVIKRLHIQITRAKSGLRLVDAIVGLDLPNLTLS